LHAFTSRVFHSVSWVFLFIIMLEFAIKGILSLWHCMVVVTSDALSLELKAELKIFLYVNLPFINTDNLHILDGVYHYHETFVIVLSVISLRTYPYCME